MFINFNIILLSIYFFNLKVVDNEYCLPLGNVMILLSNLFSIMIGKSRKLKWILNIIFIYHGFN
jgi:hypothetical protein